MAAKHQRILVFHCCFHGTGHFFGLAFKKSATATYENGVAREDTLPHILSLLVRSKLYLMITLCLNFTQVQDVTPCVARCMKTGYFDAIDIENLFVFHFKSHTGNAVMFAADHLHSELLS